MARKYNDIRCQSLVTCEGCQRSEFNMDTKEVCLECAEKAASYDITESDRNILKKSMEECSKILKEDSPSTMKLARLEGRIEQTLKDIER